MTTLVIVGEVVGAMAVYIIVCVVVGNLLRASVRYIRGWLEYWREVRLFRRQVNRTEIINGEFWERLDGK